MPLIVLFFCVIFPQLVSNSMGHGGGSVVQEVLSACFLVLAILYLVIFAIFAIQFYQYEKNIGTTDKGWKGKYVGAAGMILLFALLSGYVGYVFWDSRQSEHKVLEKDNGFTIESERLNETVTQGGDLKKGDVIIR